MMCINLTILVDHNTTLGGKTLALFISTMDSSVSVAVNMTIVNIKSQCKNLFHVHVCGK